MTTKIDWCEICEEVSTHSKICEVCGEDLVGRPAAAAAGSGTPAAAAASMSQEEAATILSAVEAHRIGAASASAAVTSGEGPSITSVAQSWASQDQELLREAVRTATGAIATGDGGGDGEWQTPPPEAMNPSAASGKDRPTSRECIERIPRIAVGANSSILHECCITVQPPVKCGPFGGCGGSAGNAIKRKVHTYDSAVVAEFGPAPPYNHTGRLVHSSILHECCITVQPPVKCGPFGGCGGSAGNAIKRKVHTYDSAVVAEFGPAPPYNHTGRLVLCHPTTGRGGLEPTTISSLSANSNYPTIAYMERGEGVTFVRKALMAQAAGASAVIVGNNCGVWPYVMQDSAGEATKGVVKMGNLKCDIDDDDGKEGAKDADDKDTEPDSTPKDDSTSLKIPVVMVKRSDGNYIRKLLEQSPGCTTRCTIAAKVLGEKGGCIICTDKFDVGDTVMRLPSCSHCFHEKCALTWLTKHNTCPMCRRELPTDDKEYESRRRAEGRSHAAASGDSAGLEMSQWESLFG